MIFSCGIFGCKIMKRRQKNSLAKFILESIIKVLFSASQIYKKVYQNYLSLNDAIKEIAV